jgi:RimJ/RimL family protein N-acetyltransferase
MTDALPVPTDERPRECRSGSRHHVWVIRPPTLETDRLRLDPLRVDDAEEMARVLADPSLYAFTGGGPPTAEELRGRYAEQAVGRSADGREWWLNWIVRRRTDGDAIGYVQATVADATGDHRKTNADVAWVIGVPWQGHRSAAEAAAAMIAWLTTPQPLGAGVAVVSAHIHPDHAASASVARRVGLEPTDEIEDGEVVWLSALGAPDRVESGRHRSSRD